MILNDFGTVSITSLSLIIAQSTRYHILSALPSLHRLKNRLWYSWSACWGGRVRFIFGLELWDILHVWHTCLTTIHSASVHALLPFEFYLQLQSSIDSWCFEITFWSRTANSGKHTANENSGLITIGVSNNLWEVSTQGFGGIDAIQNNCPNELCNITRMLDCNSEKKRMWLKTHRKNWSRTLWSLILLVKDALTSYLIDQGRFDVLSYWSWTLWRLIFLFLDALKFHLIVLGRFEVLSCWSRTLWRLIFLLKDAMKSNLIGQGHFEVLPYWSRSLWRLILSVKDALKSYLIDQGRFDVLSYCSRTLWSLLLLVKDALKSYLIDEGRFEILSYWSRTL